MKIIKLFTVCITSATLLLAGCSNLNNTNLSLEKNTFTVSGNLVLGSESGAAPVSRTATASYSDDITWKITASKGSSTYSPKDYVSGSSFTFDFEEPGEYTVKAEAVSEGSVFASGSEKITVKESGNKSVTIKALPVVSIALGSINLEINFDSSAASSVSSVYVEWQEPEFDRTAKALGFPMEAETADGAKTPELTPEVQAAMDAFYAWAARCYEGEFNKSFDIVNGKVTISYDDIFCGAHSVKLCFNDAAGNSLYSCKELINVYSGFTTDTWYGTASYLADEKFTLKGTMIDGYGAEIVPNTKMVLYNGGENFTYYIVDSASAAITNDTAKVETVYSASSFCFDSNGYFYVLANRLESATYIKSNKPGFGEKTLNNSDYPDAMYLYGDLGGLLTVDRVTDRLYMYDYQYAQVHQITQDDGTYTFDNDQSDYDEAKTISLSNDSNNSDIRGATAFTVHNGFAYFASADSETLIIIDLNNVAAGSKAVSLELSGMELSSEAKFTDMLYQDGYIYLLLRDYCTNGNELNSRGAVLRYDTISGSVETPLGFAAGTTPAALSGAKLSTFTMVDNSYQKLYNDANLTTQWYLNADKEFTYGSTKHLYEQIGCSICAPNPLGTSISENEFYGPSKFIAIKPKKLVIADDGIAFYTDNDVLKYKNVNRVVTVDLDSFTISNIENVDVSLEPEETSEIIIANCSGSTPYEKALADEISLGNPKYYSSTGHVTSNDDVCIGIQCGD